MRLLLQNERGDSSVVSAACSNDPHVPDRILPFYYNCWWNPFNISKNWDGAIDNIIKIYCLQARHMAPVPNPPLVSSYLSDIATEALVNCIKSLKVSRAILDVDTTETLKEISQTMLLVNRTQSLLEKVKAKEEAQVQVFAAEKIAEAIGGSAASAAKLLEKAKNADRLV
jgi:hypothetical protein